MCHFKLFYFKETLQIEFLLNFNKYSVNAKYSQIKTRIRVNSYICSFHLTRFEFELNNKKKK
jgi:hypothetical protein